ncbi:hypothetical protein PIB30_069087 [Stylosanthes scabra]|uniref:Uncharacterized protein n=1 Tax=Stylosanthes scabra TaxID=79078 RepID=A0ABU6ZLS0_9FABA|nr:hypothetical protein [Stylosanthes scabra]
MGATRTYRSCRNRSGRRPCMSRNFQNTGYLSSSNNPSVRYSPVAQLQPCTRNLEAQYLRISGPKLHPSHLINPGTPEAGTWKMFNTVRCRRCAIGCEEWKCDSTVSSPIAIKGLDLEAAIDILVALVPGDNDPGNVQGPDPGGTELLLHPEGGIRLPRFLMMVGNKKLWVGRLLLPTFYEFGFPNPSQNLWIWGMMAPRIMRTTLMPLKVKQCIGSTAYLPGPFILSRTSGVVLEVNVWNQAVVALGFTAGLLEGRYENGIPFSILLIIRRVVPQYPALPYLVPRKADIGTSAAHEGKLSANWKGLLCIREDPRKGTFKLENLIGAKVPRSWNRVDLTKYNSKFS